ncbi:MAG: transposase [Tildeniella torsiva UHER 1998/13D]|jgi:REP element-mobilizing transposase RayT|nr:transposase [Tildeniella torsiva UHER 1998/13D]
MAYDPARHHRQSIRLRGFDYSSAGAYFITLCTQNRACLFGDIADGVIVLNSAGQMVNDWWLALNQKFPGIQTDESVVMPNHFHGIIVINPPPVGADPRVCPDPDIEDATDGELPHSRDWGEHIGSPLLRVMQWFKTMTTNYYIRGVKENGWPPFEKRVWQRNYYDHIIRNEADLTRIQAYIRNNPALWQVDQLHPQNPSKW